MWKLSLALGFICFYLFGAVYAVKPLFVTTEHRNSKEKFVQISIWALAVFLYFFIPLSIYTLLVHYQYFILIKVFTTIWLFYTGIHGAIWCNRFFKKNAAEEGIQLTAIFVYFGLNLALIFLVWKASAFHAPWID